MKEETKPVPTPPVKKGGMAGVMEQVGNQHDPKEQLWLEMGQNLFNENKLLMISRLNGGRFEYIAKNIILVDFYEKYFNGCKISFKYHKLEGGKIRKEVVSFRPDPDKVLSKVYNRFINKILKLTISDGGEGRSEIITILNGQRNELIEKVKSMAMMQ